MDAGQDPAKLFAEIWPDGIPERERIVWEALPDGQRGTVARRIEAAFRGERGEPWSDLAKSVGLKRAGFYKLRAGWRENGIAGVIPNATQRVRRVALPDDHPLRANAAALLRREGGRARNVDLARRLLGGTTENTGKALAELQRVERLVQHERRALALNPDYLAKTFGSGILVDLTAVSVFLDGPWAETEPAVVAVVAEVSSGLVMGSALGSRMDAIHLELTAIRGALDFVSARRADRSDKAACDLHLTLPPGIGADEVKLDRFAEVVRHLDLGRPGGFAYGQALVQIVGPRMGRMVLAPRRTLPTDGAEYAATRVAPLMTLEQAGALWAREVLRHNEPVLDALRSGGVLDADGMPDGCMTKALTAAEALFASLSCRDQPSDS